MVKLSSGMSVLALGSIGLLLNACAGSPAVEQAAQKTPATPPPVKTCQTDYATGSHYQQHTICQAEEDENETRRQTDQIITNERHLYGNTVPSINQGPVSGGH